MVSGNGKMDAREGKSSNSNYFHYMWVLPSSQNLSSLKLKHIQSPGQASSSFCVAFRKPPPTIYTMPYAEYHAGAGTPSNRGFKGNETMNVEAMCDIDQTSFVHSLQDEQLCWTICLRGREAE